MSFFYNKNNEVLNTQWCFWEGLNWKNEQLVSIVFYPTSKNKLCIKHFPLCLTSDFLANFLSCLEMKSYYSIFFKFLSSWSFVKSRGLWDLINIISLTYLDLWSNESSQWNLAKNPANFASCQLLYNHEVYMLSHLCIIFENCHIHKYTLLYQRFTVLWSKSKTEI